MQGSKHGLTGYAGNKHGLTGYAGNKHGLIGYAGGKHGLAGYAGRGKNMVLQDMQEKTWSYRTRRK